MNVLVTFLWLSAIYIYIYLYMFRYVECTSAVIQGLKSFKKSYPGHRKKEIEACMVKAIDFIERTQQPDGSWYVFC
jgi:squalene cyclase